MHHHMGPWKCHNNRAVQISASTNNNKYAEAEASHRIACKVGNALAAAWAIAFCIPEPLLSDVQG